MNGSTELVARIIAAATTATSRSFNAWAIRRPSQAKKRRLARRTQGLRR